MIEPKIITANQLPDIPNIYGIVIGESNAGKTVFAATFPKPFFITFKIEPRQDSIAGMGDDIKIGYIEAANGLNEFEYLEEVYTKPGCWFFNQLNDKTNPLGIETIVLDSLTSLWKICAYSTLGYKYDDIYNSKVISKDYDSTLTLRQRTEINNKVLSVVNRISYYARAKKLNLIITGHLATKEDSEGNEILRLLVGSKNFSVMQLFPFVDHKMVIDVDAASKRWLHLDKTVRYPDVGCTTRNQKPLAQKTDKVSYEGLMEALGYDIKNGKQNSESEKENIKNT
jgi:hypothetical protein